MGAWAILKTPIFEKTSPRVFEPLRAEPDGFRVHLLDRSDTVSPCTSNIPTGIPVGNPTTGIPVGIPVGIIPIGIPVGSSTGIHIGSHNSYRD